MLYRFEADTLYLIEGASLTDPGVLEMESGASGTFRRVPVGSGSVTYEATQLHAQYDPSEGISAFRIWIDGWLTSLSPLTSAEAMRCSKQAHPYLPTSPHYLPRSPTSPH